MNLSECFTPANRPNTPFVDLAVSSIEELPNGTVDIDMDDPVNHPSHYQGEGGLEVIDVIKAFTSDLTGIEAVYTANIIKYILRWKKKNGLEDLEKAEWYLKELISKVEDDELLLDMNSIIAAVNVNAK